MAFNNGGLSLGTTPLMYSSPWQTADTSCYLSTDRPAMVNLQVPENSLGGSPGINSYVPGQNLKASSAFPLLERATLKMLPPESGLLVEKPFGGPCTMDSDVTSMPSFRKDSEGTCATACSEAAWLEPSSLSGFYDVSANKACGFWESPLTLGASQMADDSGSDCSTADTLEAVSPMQSRITLCLEDAVPVLGLTPEPSPIPSPVQPQNKLLTDFMTKPQVRKPPALAVLPNPAPSPAVPLPPGLELRLPQQPIEPMAVEEGDDDEEEDMLLPGREPQQSAGSKMHGTGRCKPCAFYHGKGCESGVNCSFCHLCDKGERQKRRKERKAMIRSIRRERKQQRATNTEALAAAAL